MAQSIYTATLVYATGRAVTNATFSSIRDGTGTYANTTTNAGGAVVFAGNTSSRFDEVSRGILIFNTASLPDDAVVTSATLRVRGFNKVSELGTTNLHLASASPSSNTSPVSSAYQSVGRTSFASISYASFSTSGYNTFTLNSAGRANISSTGYSRFSTQLAWDLSGSFTGSWSSWNNTNMLFRDHLFATSDYRPRLTVDYIVPATVTSSALDEITVNSAKAYGNVTATGDGTITERGFVWSTSTDPTVANSKTIVAGTTGTFDATITGLLPTTTYYVRAYAINEAGTAYSSTQESFTTTSSSGGNFLAFFT